MAVGQMKGQELLQPPVLHEECSPGWHSDLAFRSQDSCSELHSLL